MSSSIIRWLKSFIWGLILSSIITLSVKKGIPYLITSLLNNSGNSFADFFGGIDGVVIEAILLLLLTLLFNMIQLYTPYDTILNDFEEHKKNINNPIIFNVFIKYLKDIASKIRETSGLQTIDSMDRNPIDLAFEITLLDTEVVDKEDTFCVPKAAISRVRRKRILELIPYMLEPNLCLFYATEFHLLSVVRDQEKWNFDEDYRKNLKGHSINDKRRIIVINKDEVKTLNKNQKDRLESYLKWHCNNYWNTILYAVNKDNYPLKLSSFGYNITSCDELTDFVFVEYKNKKSIVFAQNDKEKCKYFIKNKTNGSTCTVDEYKKWFNMLWDNQNRLNEDHFRKFEIKTYNIQQVLIDLFKK